MGVGQFDFLFLKITGASLAEIVDEEGETVDWFYLAINDASRKSLESKKMK